MNKLFCMIIFKATLCIGAGLADAIYVNPEDVISTCENETLFVSIKPLEKITRSRTNLVKTETSSNGLCLAAKQYLQLQTPIAITVSSFVENVDYLLKLNPCKASMKTCSAIYRKAVRETIRVDLNEIELTNRVEVPDTYEDRLVEWASDVCPPYQPDCDL